MDMADIKAAVNAAISEVLHEDATTLSPTKAFNEQTDADSLAMIELFMAIEAEIEDRGGPQFKIEDHEMEDIKNLSQLYDLVAEKAGVTEPAATAVID